MTELLKTVLATETEETEQIRIREREGEVGGVTQVVKYSGRGVDTMGGRKGGREGEKKGDKEGTGEGICEELKAAEGG